MTRIRVIQDSIDIDADAIEVFNALITPSAICAWWQANSAIVLAEPNGTYAVSWGEDEDNPDYLTIARIVRYEPPEILELAEYQYRSSEGGLPFDNDLPVTLTVEQRQGPTRLHVRQTGFPAEESADMYYEGCVKGWEDTLRNIKEFLED